MTRLQPRSVGQLLDGGFEVLRFRFGTVVLVATAILVPFVVVPQVVAILTGTTSDRFSPWSLLGPVSGDAEESAALVVVSLGGASLATMLLGVGVAHLVGSWLVGEDPGPADTLRFVLRRSPVAVAAWALALMVKGATLLTCGVLTVLAVPALQCLSPVVAAEPVGAAAAVGRALRLGRRRFGRLLLVSGLWALAFALVIGIVWLAGALIQFQAGGGDSLGPWLSSIRVAVTMALIVVQSAVTALVYVDLRVRTEGLDMELQTRERFGALG